MKRPLLFAIAAITLPLHAAVVMTGALERARVFPNPWRADLHSNTQITFDQLPANSRIGIFTLSGQKVRNLSADNGSASWDRTNDSGDKVASGVYLYVVTDPQDNKTQGKLVIIR